MPSYLRGTARGLSFCQLLSEAERRSCNDTALPHLPESQAPSGSLTVTELTVEGVLGGDPQLRQLAACLARVGKCLRCFDISATAFPASQPQSPAVAELAAAAACSTALRKLRISDTCYPLDPDGGLTSSEWATALAAAALRRPGCCITHLDLSNSHIPDAAAHAIAAAIAGGGGASLRRVTLSFCGLSAEGAVAVLRALQTAAPALASVTLDGNPRMCGGWDSARSGGQTDEWALEAEECCMPVRVLGRQHLGVLIARLESGGS